LLRELVQPFSSQQIVVTKTNTLTVDEHNLRYFGRHTSLEGTSDHDCRSIVHELLCTALKCWWEFSCLL